MSFKVDGVARQLEVASDKIKAGTIDSAKLIAQEILARAIQEVPLDTGDLMHSGKVRADDTRAVVSFDTPYAIRQHEEMSYRHPGGRSAKYLERPFNEVAKDGTAERIIRRKAGEVFD